MSFCGCIRPISYLGRCQEATPHLVVFSIARSPHEMPQPQFVKPPPSQLNSTRQVASKLIRDNLQSPSPSPCSFTAAIMAPTKDARRADLSELPPVSFEISSLLPPRRRMSLARCDSMMRPGANLRTPVVPYQEPKATGDSTDFSSTMSTTLPMAAMFTRNKLVGWYVG